METNPKTKPRLDRTRILDVAERHFSKMGFRKTSLADVARELGVVKGALYYYIPQGKQELFDLVFERHQERTLEAMKEAVGRAAGPVEALRAVVVAKIGSFRETQRLKGVSREVMEETAAMVRQREDQFLFSERELIASILTAGADSGVFRSVSPLPLAAGAIQALLRSLTNPLLFEGEDLEEKATALLDPILDLLVHGLRPR